MVEFVEHAFDPVYSKDSRVLILGTMPSPKSRERGFYYSHPQNRFWNVVSEVLSEAIPVTPVEKKDFLLRNRIALWDVRRSCRIDGADDSSIKSPVANDISIITENADITAVFTTGKKATELYKRYIYEKTGMPAVYLPSTSPANRGFVSYQELLDRYSEILKFII